MQYKVAFPPDDFIGNHNCWVRIGLTFQRDRSIWNWSMKTAQEPAAWQGCNRTKEEQKKRATSNLFFVYFLSGRVRDHSIHFHEYVCSWELLRKQTPDWKVCFLRAWQVHFSNFVCLNGRCALGKFFASEKSSARTKYFFFKLHDNNIIIIIII